MASSATTALKIRRAKPDDLAPATALVEAAWTQSNAEFLPTLTMALLTAENSVAGLMASRSHELWIAELPDQMAAVLGADPNGYIWACYVAPDLQRTGIGSALMAEIKTHFVAKGVEQLSLDIIQDNTSASAFYKHLGWMEESRREEQLPGHLATAIRLVFRLS